MKLIDGVNQNGKPFHIPDCVREELPEFLKQKDLAIGVEIGVFRGEFTENFAKAGLNIYAIDPWIGYSGAGRTEMVQAKQDTNFLEAEARLKKYKNCIPIRKTSMEALSQFKNNSLDFVYIDGDHRFPYIAEDLYEWFFKVKTGGIIGGHDYFCTQPKANNVIIQVKPIVDAFITAYEIENFYTFGTDRNLSWMFFKP